VFDLAVLVLVPGAVAFAAAMDLFTLTIPNRISAAMVLAFFPVAALAGLGWWEIADHLGAGVLVLGIGILLFAGGWFGGGDAKLLAAIALWIGFDHLFPYLIYVALAGGTLAMAFESIRSVPLPKLLLGEQWAHRLHRPDSGIPYGIALAAGALLVYPQTVWFTSLLR
jgi:prepilin peptidase CpaA